MATLNEKKPEPKTAAMTRFQIPASTVTLMLRALAITTMLAAPVLAVPAMGSSNGSIIEAPDAGQSGVGFVILVSLQRN